jgi:hypothetical protein
MYSHTHNHVSLRAQNYTYETSKELFCRTMQISMFMFLVHPDSQNECTYSGWRYFFLCFGASVLGKYRLLNVTLLFTYSVEYLIGLWLECGCSVPIEWIGSWASWRHMISRGTAVRILSFFCRRTWVTSLITPFRFIPGESQLYPLN